MTFGGVIGHLSLLAIMKEGVRCGVEQVPGIANAPYTASSDTIFMSGGSLRSRLSVDSRRVLSVIRFLEGMLMKLAVVR